MGGGELDSTTSCHAGVLGSIPSEAKEILNSNERSESNARAQRASRRLRAERAPTRYWGSWAMMSRCHDVVPDIDPGRPIFDEELNSCTSCQENNCPNKIILEEEINRQADFVYDTNIIQY